VPTLRGIDGRALSLRAWLHERSGVLLRKLRVRADPEQLPPPPHVELMLGVRSAGKGEATLRVDPDYVFRTYEERRALYTDFLTGFLLPRTTIWTGDDLMIRINSLGCRGPELTLGEPVVAFFGDSTTLGVLTTSGFHGDSWTEHVDLPGYGVLNAGVEGIDLGHVARRYESLRHRVPLACAVFYTGWHNLIYNTRTPEYWEECLQRYLSPDHQTVLLTLPTPLLPEMRERGIAPLVNERQGASLDDDFFHFWRGWKTEPWLVELIESHERFNAHLADFCARTGTPLIDLYSFAQPRSYDDAPNDFFDVCHFRPRAYPKVAAFLSSELRTILPDAPPPVDGWRARAEPPALQATEDLRENIYPIW
jgi:hypothetical protein